VQLLGRHNRILDSATSSRTADFRVQMTITGIRGRARFRIPGHTSDYALYEVRPDGTVFPMYP
jgi:hypothetical protein